MYVYDTGKFFYGFLKSKSVRKTSTKSQNINSGLWKSFRDKICVFLAKTLTSEARTKFFKRRTHKFWVWKTSNIRGVYRIWIMTVWPTKHFYLRKSDFWVDFLNSSFDHLKLCQPSEYFVILCEFLAKNLTSETRRKFSMRSTRTFWVCKTFYWIRKM